MSNEKFKVKFGLAVGDTAATVDGTTGDIVTNGSITLGGNDIYSNGGSLAIALSGNNVRTVGDLEVDGNHIKNSNGTTALTFTDNTGSVAVSNILQVTGNIIKASNGNQIITFTDATNVTGGGNIIANGSLIANTHTTGAANLTLNTASGTNSGSIVITAGANGNITTTPNGTGNAAFTMSNGGNITNTRNYVYGAIRDATTQSNGDIWSFTSGSGTGYRGISLDNSVDTTKRPGLVLRGYGGGLSGSLPRSSIIFDNSRGSAASPTAVQQFDAIGEILAAGRTSTGWVGDLVASVPFAQKFYASENWVSTTNVGTGWLLTCQPTATNFTTSSLITVIDASPQQMALRADTMAVSAGKTTSFVATGCSVSGTTLTIGTLTSGSISVGTSVQVVGGLFLACYITANISGSGSGSTWTLSSSQTTNSGLTAVGYKGAIGYAPGISTVDILAPMKLYNGTVTSRDGTLTYNNNSGTNMITMAANGRFQVVDVNNTANTMVLDNPTSGGDSNLTLNLNLRNTNSATQLPVFNFTNYRYNSGSSVYVPTQSGDVLGGFKFNGQYSSTGSSSIGSPTQVQALATETWSSTAQGTKLNFVVNKKGTTTGLTTAALASDVTTFQSDSYIFQNSSATQVTGNNINYNRVYGQWQYDATITPAAANTAYAFPFQGANAVTDFANIASAASTSRIIPGAAGTYRLAFSLQLQNTSNASDYIAYIWWRKNGVDVANSMGQVYVTKGNSTITAWDNMIQASNSTDYWELMYAVNNTALIFPYFAATSFGPATASIFLNLVPVGA